MPTAFTVSGHLVRNEIAMIATCCTAARRRALHMRACVRGQLHKLSGGGVGAPKLLCTTVSSSLLLYTSPKKPNNQAYGEANMQSPFPYGAARALGRGFRTPARPLLLVFLSLHLTVYLWNHSRLWLTYRSGGRLFHFTMDSHSRLG